jgi:cell division protein FtsZ
MADWVFALPSAFDGDETPPEPRGALVPFPFIGREPAVAQPRIAVVGIGGAGTNALSRIGNIAGTNVRRIALNTDAQSLAQAHADDTLCLGETLTAGQGTGGDAELGARAADSSRHHIAGLLRGHDLIFVLAGLGGGTGSGAAPLVARIGRDQGALVVGMAMLPFSFEGVRRRGTSVSALAALAGTTDALLTFPNDRLLFAAQGGEGMQEAFVIADAAMRRAIMGVVDIVAVPGIINVDFADVRAVLREAGPSLMASGSAVGEDRAARAVEDALTGGWLGADVRGAQRALVNITASADVSLAEVAEVTARVSDVLAPDAQSVFGAAVDPTLSDALHVTLIAGGIPPLGVATTPLTP